MKNLLYITVNSKAEASSTSKTVGREFVNRFLATYPDYKLSELDLYSEKIPEPNHRHFTSRAEVASGSEYDNLSEEDKRIVDRMNQLCNGFLNADICIIATPMWSLFFPARLSMYLDCIIQNNKLIQVSPEGAKGLLDNKERKMVFIQSTGGVYPKLLSSKLLHGANYLNDIFTFMGVKQFEKLMVEGVDMVSVGRDKAIRRAFADMDQIINKLG